ncbi:hypothetical protein D9M68_704970 [compost metagenome]
MINTNRIKSLLKDCQGVSGIASPKQPQEVTTLKAADTKVNSVKKTIKAKSPLVTQLRQKPNNNKAPSTISKTQSKTAIPVAQLLRNPI